MTIILLSLLLLASAGGAGFFYVRDRQSQKNIKPIKQELNKKNELIKKVLPKHKQNIEKIQKLKEKNKDLYLKAQQQITLKKEINDLKTKLVEQVKSVDQVKLQNKKEANDLRKSVQQLKAKIKKLQDDKIKLSKQKNSLEAKLADPHKSRASINLDPVTSNEQASDNTINPYEPAKEDTNTNLPLEDSHQQLAAEPFSTPQPSAVETSQEVLDSAEVDTRIKELEAQVTNANEMAMTMMQASGDQSCVVNYARNSIDVHTLEELAETIFEQLLERGLNGFIQIRGSSETLNLNSNKTNPSRNDVDFIDSLDHSQRYHEKPPELVICFNELTLYIKNMPSDDMDEYGRYRDMMATIIELSIATLHNIEAEQKTQKQYAVLKKVVETTSNIIENVEKDFQKKEQESRDILDSLASILESETFTNSIDPLYRPVYTQIVNESKERFQKLHEAGSGIDDSFSKIIRSMKHRL